MFFGEQIHTFLWGIYSGVELLSFKYVVTYSRRGQSFQKCLYQSTFPPAVHESSRCSTSSPVFVSSLFYFSFRSGYDVVSNYGLKLHFHPLLLISCVFFISFFSHLEVIFCKAPVPSLLPIFC